MCICISIHVCMPHTDLHIIIIVFILVHVYSSICFHVCCHILFCFVYTVSILLTLGVHPSAKVTVVVPCVYVCMSMCVCVSTHICRLTHWNHKTEITTNLSQYRDHFKFFRFSLIYIILKW